MVYLNVSFRSYPAQAEAEISNHLSQEEIEALPSVRMQSLVRRKPNVGGWGMGKTQKHGDLMGFHGNSHEVNVFSRTCSLLGMFSLGYFIERTMVITPRSGHIDPDNKICIQLLLQVHTAMSLCYSFGSFWIQVVL